MLSGCYTEVACYYDCISGWILGHILLAGIIIEAQVPLYFPISLRQPEKCSREVVSYNQAKGLYREVVLPLFLTYSLARVSVQEESVYPGEGVVCLSVQQVHGGSQHLHLWPHGHDPVAVAGEEGANGPQLFRAVLNVPDLVVKVPGQGNEMNT